MNFSTNIDLAAINEHFNTLREQYSKPPEFVYNRFKDVDGETYAVDLNSDDKNVFTLDGARTSETIADRDKDGIIDYIERESDGVQARVVNNTDEDFEYAEYSVDTEEDNGYVIYTDNGNDGVLDYLEFHTSDKTIEYKFDEDGKPISYKELQGDDYIVYEKIVSDATGIEGKPINAVTFLYNEYGKLKEKHYDTGSDGVIDSKVIYELNEDGEVTQELYYNDSDDIVDSKVIYELNENNERQSVTKEKYDNGKLSSSSKDEFIYDDKGILYKTIKTTCAYDDEGNVVNEVCS